MRLGQSKWLLPLLALTTCTLVQCEGIEREKDEQKILVKRNAHRHRGRAARNRIHEQRRMLNNSLWPMFAPLTPSPDQINCYIEVEITHRYGGRCVRLGGAHQRAGCQSGVYTDFWHNECNTILAEREATQQAISASGSQSSAAQEGQQDDGTPASD